MSTSTKVVQKCKSCGGDLIFIPAKNGLVCSRCGAFQSVNATVTTEKSFQALLNRAPTWQVDTAVLRCEQCGAKSVVVKNDLVSRCEYCGTANMVKTAEAPGLRPDTVVLFGLNKKEANKHVANWLAKRAFVPSDFKRQFKDRQLNGVYYPAFTFDAYVTTKFTATLVQTSTSTITIEGKEEIYSQVNRHSFNDFDTSTFDDILILANDNEIASEVLEKIQTFDTNHGQAFQQSFLSGYNICQASKDAQTCWNEAKQRMEHVIRKKIEERYTSNDVRVENLRLDLTFTNITYKYVLLPIYLGHIDYNGKRYPLYMNGENGKIHAKTPKSFWKILFAAIFGGAIAFGVGIILAMFL